MITPIYLLFFLLIEIFFYCIATVAAARDGNYTLGKSCSMGLAAPVFVSYKNNCAEVNLTNANNFEERFEDVDSLVFTSKIGEGYLLSLEECSQIYIVGVKAARSIKKKVFVQIGDPTMVGMKLARLAENLKVDGILTEIGLFYRPMSTQDVVNGMKLLAACAPNTPIFLRIDAELSSGLNLNYAEIYTRLTQEVPNFVGYLANLEVCLRINSYGIYNPESQCLVAVGHHAVQAAADSGLDGVMSVGITLFPKVSAGIWYARNKQTAANNQIRLNKLIALFRAPNNSFPLPEFKAAYTAITAKDVVNIRPPFKRVTCRRQKTITTELEKMGIQLKAPVRSCRNDRTNSTSCCPINCQ